MRQNASQRRAAPTPTPVHIKVVDRKIRVRDGAEIPVRIYSPVDKGLKGSPLIVNYHGGGFIMGGLEMGTEFGRNMVTFFNAVVVDVDYRLAPEFPFPTPVNDSWDALKWVSRWGPSEDDI
jgi:acetyl esterase/lipase